MTLPTYLVAAVMAATLSVRLRHYPNRTYWRCWDERGLRWGIGAVAGIHAAAGLVAAALAFHLDWHVTNHGQAVWLANGAAYGLAGALLLRIDVNGFGVGLTSPPVHMLRQGLEFLEPVLDKRTELAVEAKLDSMNHRELTRFAWKLYFRHVADDIGIKQSIRRRLLEQLKLHTGWVSDEVRSSEYLRAFCLVQITTHRHDSMMT
jgi:hypothetical protein